jgi:outer membrane receptor protein involved in Fe transport
MERVQGDDEQITPRYADVFTSLYYDLDDGTTLAAHLLLGEDDLRLVSRVDDDIDSAGKGRAGHAWLTLDRRFGADLRSNTVLSVSSARQWRDAIGEEEQRAGNVHADFRFRFLDLRSDWTWNLDDHQLLLFGANSGRAEADYDYWLVATKVNPTAPGGVVNISYAHDLDVKGDKLGAHAAWRGRVGRDLILEAGARWDRYGYPARSFSVVSPRLNAVYGIGERGELRAAWGIAHQPQGIHELQVEDDLTRFFEPERVRQAVLGYTHRLDHGWSARLDVYRKRYSRLRPRFENALDPVQLIPEGAVDRIRIDAPEACAQGVELTVRREAERGLAGWTSVAFAKAEEAVAGQGWTPRLWDQERSLSMGLSWTGAKWNLNLAGLFHSGTPTTTLRQTTIMVPGGELADVVVSGEHNAVRLGHYARLDLRASRAVQFRGGRFSYYFEITNLFDRENPCCKESYFLETDANGRVRLVIEESDWLPLLPSLGFQFEF